MKSKDIFYALFVFVLLVVFIGFLSSCSSGYHLRKAKKKCPECFNSDSTIRYDTIVHHISKDSSFNLYSSKDTLYLKERSLTLKYFYNTTTNTVFMGGDCRDSVVYKTVVKNQTIIEKESFLEGLLKYWWLLIIGIVLAMSGFLAFRK